MHNLDIAINQTNLVVGAVATGKTIFCKKVINEFLRLYPERKILIISDTQEYSNHVSLDEAELLIEAGTIKNQLIVIDSGSTFFRNRTRSIDPLLVTSRSFRNTIVIVYQSIASVDPTVMANTKNLLLYQEYSDLKKIQRALPTFLICITSYVKKKRYEYVKIDLENNEVKCKGNDFNYACYRSTIDLLFSEYPLRWQIKQSVKNLMKLYKYTK